MIPLGHGPQGLAGSVRLQHQTLQESRNRHSLWPLLSSTISNPWKSLQLPAQSCPADPAWTRPPPKHRDHRQEVTFGDTQCRCHSAAENNSLLLSLRRVGKESPPETGPSQGVGQPREARAASLWLGKGFCSALPYSPAVLLLSCPPQP